MALSDVQQSIDGVRHTLAKYNIAGDRGRAQELANTFLETGVLETPVHRLVGRDAIAQELLRLQMEISPRLTRVRHHLTTCLIEVGTSRQAKSRTYFFVMTDIGLDHSGVYSDTLEFHEGEWLFELRTVRIDWISKDTLFTFGSTKRTIETPSP